jgi:tryptophan synthase alpha chain
MATRIDQIFARCRDEGRAAFIGYLTAGDPNPEATPLFVAAMQRAGCDLIELGVPFSDPIADGPVIQRGSDRALQAGTTLAKVLEMAAKIRETSEIPLLLFTYMNPALRYGTEELARTAKSVGIDGVLLTDLSVEEAPRHTTPFKDQGLDTVFLGAPTSTPERLAKVAAYSSGFIYLVSRTGVTGEQVQLSASAVPLVNAMRAITDLPLAVGFGISTPQQVEQVAASADGVVVGSALVRQVENSLKAGKSVSEIAADLEALTASLTKPLISEKAAK